MKEDDFSRLELSLPAALENYKYFRSLLDPATRLLVLVKANAYGHGAVEFAAMMQRAGADYLAVALPLEAVELRRAGISLPILVLTAGTDFFEEIIRYRLEPGIPNLYTLKAFAAALREKGLKDYPVHIKLDTGMHRLGFAEADIPELAGRLADLAPLLQVQSIFTHLACSDDPALDDFTRLQISHFTAWADRLDGLIAQPPAAPILHHILNSSGIVRFPEAQLDMVRLGIGLYGVAPQPEVQRHLRPVSRLVTRISQLKDIPEGDSVSYNRRWVAQRPSRIAILPIGYADGLSRQLGYGHGRVLVGENEAPLIGTVCMDMCFADVTGLPCAEGDPVVIFGHGDLLQRNAAAARTIPYEMLTSVSPRVKRIYYQE